MANQLHKVFPRPIGLWVQPIPFAQGTTSGVKKRHIETLGMKVTMVEVATQMILTLYEQSKDMNVCCGPY